MTDTDDFRVSRRGFFASLLSVAVAAALPLPTGVAAVIEQPARLTAQEMAIKLWSKRLMREAMKETFCSSFMPQGGGLIVVRDQPKKLIRL